MNELDLASLLQEYLKSSSYALRHLGTYYKFGELAELFTIDRTDRSKDAMWKKWCIGLNLIGYIEVYPTKIKCVHLPGARSRSALPRWVSIDFHDPDAFEKLDHEIGKMKLAQAGRSQHAF